MKSFLTTIAVASVLALTGALSGCGGHSSTPHKDGGTGDHPVDKPITHHDGSVDGTSDGPTTTCGSTGPKQMLGVSCNCDGELCCDTACTGGCFTCSSSAQPGMCLKRTSGTAPRNPTDCATTDPTKCGTDGTCDGAGACRLYTGNVCQGTCDGDSVVGAHVCDGQGNCRAGATQMLCIPYTCNPATGTCFQPSCTDSSQCDSQHTCDFSSGSCGTEANGQYCQSDDNCLSGHCADNVCCNIACQGACVACNLSGRLGTCWPVDTGKGDPRRVCTDQGAASCGHNGTCDGVG